MFSASNLLDIANIVFFVTSIPQLRAAYVNRKDLSAISYFMLIGYLIACVMFGMANYSFDAYIAVVLNIVCSFIYGLQIYWKLRK